MVVSRAYPDLGVATGHAFVDGIGSWRLGRGGVGSRAELTRREEGRRVMAGRCFSPVSHQSRHCRAIGSYREVGEAGRGARGGSGGVRVVNVRLRVDREVMVACFGRTRSAADAIAGGEEEGMAMVSGGAGEKACVGEERGSVYWNP